MKKNWSRSKAFIGDKYLIGGFGTVVGLSENH